MKSSEAHAHHHAARQPAPQPKPRRRSVAEPVAAKVRELMIAEAAYYIAERRAFEPGAALDDWLTAEAEIDRQLAALEAGEEALDELDEMAEAAARMAG